MTDIIDQAKAYMASLMRAGMKLNLVYPRGIVTLTPANLLESAIGRCDCAALHRLLTEGDFAEFGRIIHAAREAEIAEVCDDEVAEWLAYQAKAKEDAA